MDFDSIVESGYYVRACRYVRPYIEAVICFQGGSVTMGWVPSNHDRERKYIDFFPYINPEDNRLRLWDMEMACDLAVTVNTGFLAKQAKRCGSGDDKTSRIGKHAPDSFHVNDVNGRWPKVYAMVRKMGYWRDADS